MSAEDDTKRGFVPRISQLDSILLTDEAYSLIKSQVLTCVKYVGQNYLTRLEPEIEAGLRYILLRYTVQKARRSVGQQLLQIRYEDSVSLTRLRNYVYLLVFGRWVRQRAGDLAAGIFKKEGARVLASQCVNLLEILYKVAEVLNLLVFLHQVLPFYRTVLDVNIWPAITVFIPVMLQILHSVVLYAIIQ
ncbi:putative peroxisome biogenesis factor 2-like [Penaeus vannamei]|uniref:RING-type E3 ubiquitin transferase (cysteine targeting) n=1 Tax=Penaeus vannamei TaxID=6689 RepID=A0A3R7MIY2_PENVA|nr:putative peroxisome biogenesis factor 2-like [Penaeus vannamei]